jgi:hypothetical protein
MQVMPILRQLLNLNQVFVIGCLDYLLALRAMIGERYPPLIGNLKDSMLDTQTFKAVIESASLVSIFLCLICGS